MAALVRGNHSPVATSAAFVHSICLGRIAKFRSRRRRSRRWIHCNKAFKKRPVSERDPHTFLFGCGSKPMGSHFGVGAPPILVYFNGNWDNHWGHGIFDLWQFVVVFKVKPLQTRCKTTQYGYQLQHIHLYQRQTTILETPDVRFPGTWTWKLGIVAKDPTRCQTPGTCLKP